VKKYFEQKYGLNVLKLELPLMNRLNEFWGLTGWSKGKMVNKHCRVKGIDGNF
jgi:hypothetical protein